MSIASRVSHIRAISFDGDMTLWDFEKVMRHSLAHALAEVQKHLPGQACADLTIERGFHDGRFHGERFHGNRFFFGGSFASPRRRLERNRKFVDSPLEGDGFEPSVPRRNKLCVAPATNVPGRDDPLRRRLGRTCDRTKAHAAAEGPAVTRLPLARAHGKPRRSRCATILCCPTAIELPSSGNYLRRRAWVASRHSRIIERMARWRRRRAQRHTAVFNLLTK
jgi:hypothetical protein